MSASLILEDVGMAQLGAGVRLICRAVHEPVTVRYLMESGLIIDVEGVVWDSSVLRAEVLKKAPKGDKIVGSTELPAEPEGLV